MLVEVFGDETCARQLALALERAIEYCDAEKYARCLVDWNYRGDSRGETITAFEELGRRPRRPPRR
jgi:hypothetical protein